MTNVATIKLELDRENLANTRAIVKAVHDLQFIGFKNAMWSSLTIPAPSGYVTPTSAEGRGYIQMKHGYREFGGETIFYHDGVPHDVIRAHLLKAEGVTLDSDRFEAELQRAVTLGFIAEGERALMCLAHRRADGSIVHTDFGEGKYICRLLFKNGDKFTEHRVGYAVASIEGAFDIGEWTRRFVVTREGIDFVCGRLDADRRSTTADPATETSGRNPPIVKGTHDDAYTSDIIARWKEIARREIDEIGGWRDADPKRLQFEYWPKRERRTNAVVLGTIPNHFFTDTTYLLGLIARLYPSLDPTPLQGIYKWVRTWHEDRSAARLPPQSKLWATLDLAAMLVLTIEYDVDCRMMGKVDGERANATHLDGHKRRASADDGSDVTKSVGRIEDLPRDVTPAPHEAVPLTVAPPAEQKPCPPSRTRAAAVYEWAIESIPEADTMPIRELFMAIQETLGARIEAAPPHAGEVEKLQDLLDSLPDNSATFGRYLRGAGIKRYNTRGERARRTSHFKRCDQF